MSEGCCYVDIDYDEAPKVMNKLIRRSRKEHVCCECGGTIPRGALYEDVSGLWDEKWGRYRTCWTCTLIRDEYCAGGYYYGGLRETLLECKGFDYVTNELAKWAEVEDEREEHHRTSA